ncbi:hypothetical protein CDAR_473041 [Caerostris darwini]|uniref:Uncharacterized protein n=1 Tax=Caerostris darwini TaxID=1538125 RepID=A0AAV4VAS7_9ARAC|nr:hypothetical protein CDAR_473041 [Caerostris darwini]
MHNVRKDPFYTADLSTSLCRPILCLGGVRRGRSWIDRTFFTFVLQLPTPPWGGLKQFEVISFRYADAYLMRFRDIKIAIPISTPTPPSHHVPFPEYFP